MLPSMRFFIISIVSIFAALGIGILIGFTINAKDFVIEQNAIINDIMESQLELLIDENQELKENERILTWENNYMDEYISSSYHFIMNKRLDGLKIGLIETNEDYITSSIGRDLELAGAKVLNVTTINNNFLNKEGLNNLFKISDFSIPKNSIETSLKILTESIITGIPHPILNSLIEEGYINTSGRFDEDIDYLIICGGSNSEPSRRISQIDGTIVSTVKKYAIPILGVEKSEVDYSYIQGYKDLGISTVDNVDMTIGKVAMILAMEGITGNYGIKKTAESVIPNGNRLVQD